MTNNELLTKSNLELLSILNEKREELFKLNMQHSSGQLEKTHRLSEVKKDVARVFTVLHSKSKKV